MLHGMHMIDIFFVFHVANCLRLAIATLVLFCIVTIICLQFCLIMHTYINGDMCIAYL